MGKIIEKTIPEKNSNPGLQRKTVRLEEYDPRWADSANEVIKLLKYILKDDAADVQHVGSTAVRGMAAKPIIDIAVAAFDFADITKHNDRLEEAGIIFRGEDVPGQLLYAMGDFEQDTRTHHIHVVLRDSLAFRNYIYFRDYLNENPEIALEYAELKRKLAKKYPEDRVQYTNGKNRFIRRILYAGIIGTVVRGKIDRPVGSRHPRHPDMIYPVNYGYVEGLLAADGAEQDVYVLGTDSPIGEYEGRVIAVYHRYDDIEDKWIVSVDEKEHSDEEILEQIRFQEQYFTGKLFR